MDGLVQSSDFLDDLQGSMPTMFDDNLPHEEGGPALSGAHAGTGG
eukprot:CAMPEP_0170484600 /NCGR_PEP_ID=MMETSP0208-20121228/4017_1 /TAXON_ID=197538 /ORGANISM="Strombidium inclinatum, Strain S3" /LENGTH=44 /DNA_ID= /DNA_START= /DNA_END= /DNA_ORIENTATION=